MVNAGTSVLTGVELFDDLPAGARLVSASDNGRQEGNRVHWLLGDAPAGQGKSVTVVLTVDKAGEAVNRVTAKADRSVTAEAGRDENAVRDGGRHRHGRRHEQ